MKKLFYLAAAAFALLTASAQAADTGNWVSYLKINGCACDYGSFSTSTAKYSVDATGPQGTLGSSKTGITISTGNQTQSVQVAFTVNGTPVGSTQAPSGQQDGVYYTSAPIDLTPGSNLITITTSDPSHKLNPTVVTITVPYRPVVLTNTAAPALSDTPQVGKALTCSTGTWTADPAPILTVSLESSTDGQAWSRIGTSVTPKAYDAGRLFRCQVVANNGFTTATVYSDASSLSGPPVVAPPVTTPTATGGAVAPTAATKTATPTTAAPLVQPTVTAPAKAAQQTPKLLKVLKPTTPIRVHRYTSWLTLSVH